MSFEWTASINEYRELQTKKKDKRATEKKVRGEQTGYFLSGSIPDLFGDWSSFGVGKDERTDSHVPMRMKPTPAKARVKNPISESAVQPVEMGNFG